MPIIYSIEGNIGSGKSTLVKLLKQNLIKVEMTKIIYLQEPVEEWKNIKTQSGENIIEKFYSNQHKYAFSFQMMAYISRLSQLHKTIRNNPSAIIITERSVFTDRNVFAKMLYDAGKIEEIDYTIYNKWFYEFITDIPITGVIYLDTKPSKCLERINKRNRDGETISLEYLTNCKKYHDKWICEEEKLVNKKNILFLEGNEDFLDEPKSMQNILTNIEKFMNKTLPSSYINQQPFDISVHIC